MRNQWRGVSLLAVIAIFISFSLALILPVLPHIFYFVVFLGLFAALVYAFDRWFWSMPLFNSLGLADAPDISGEWVGQLTTSFDDQSKITEIRVSIIQTWTKLEVHFFAPNSNSVSISAQIFKDEDSDDYVLTYIYHTQPREHGYKTDPPHIGLSVLRLTSSQELSGYYHYYYQDKYDSTFVRGQLVLKRREPFIEPNSK